MAKSKIIFAGLLIVMGLLMGWHGSSASGVSSAVPGDLRCPGNSDLLRGVYATYLPDDQPVGEEGSPKDALGALLKDVAPDLPPGLVQRFQVLEQSPRQATLVLPAAAGIQAVASTERPRDGWQAAFFEACAAVLKGDAAAVGDGPKLGLTTLAAPLATLGVLLISPVRRRKLILVLGGLLAVGTFAWMIPRASAHCAGGDCGFDVYEREWYDSHHTGLDITWRFAIGFPDGVKRDRMKEAFGKWNGLGQKMKFSQLSEWDFSDIECDDGSPNGVFYTDISPIATTAFCTHQEIGYKVMHGFDIIFDSSRNWYGFDDQLGIGPNELDFESAAAHEVGHATGFSGQYDNGHFDPDGDLCGADLFTPTHTLCPSLELQSTERRSLELHDRHTFQNAYPDE